VEGSHAAGLKLGEIIRVRLGLIIGAWGLELDEFIELPEGYQAQSTGW